MPPTEGEKLSNQRMLSVIVVTKILSKAQAQLAPAVITSNHNAPYSIATFLAFLPSGVTTWDPNLSMLLLC